MARPIDDPVLADAAVELRAPQERDLPALLQAGADPQIIEWTMIPQPYGEEQAQHFIRLGADGRAAGTDVVWVWEAAESPGRALGAIGLHGIADGIAELGYWTLPAGRGRGWTTAALRLVCGWALAPDGLGLQALHWQAFAGNAASLHTAEKLGFRVAGVRRRATAHRGVLRDDVMADLLPGELR